MIELEFRRGPLDGRRVALKGDRVSIGRDMANRIVVDLPTVAARHCVLIRNGSGYHLQLGPERSAIAVNGKQSRGGALSDGDVIRFGGVEAVYHASVPADAFEFNVEPVEELPPARRKRRRPTPEQRSPRWRTVPALLLLVGLFAVTGFGLKRERWTVPTVEAEPSAEVVAFYGDRRPWWRPLLPPPIPIPEMIAPTPPGLGVAGRRAGRVYHTKDFASHQEAVDVARPGDAIVFDSTDAKPIVVHKPLYDLHFTGGIARWELHADCVDCRFLFQEIAGFKQVAGVLRHSAFLHCSLKRGTFTHVDAVSIYADDTAPLDGLTFIGFVRQLLVYGATIGPATANARWDQLAPPAILIDATDPLGNGMGSYLTNLTIRNTRAGTPIRIVRGRGIVVSQVTAMGQERSDPLIEIVQGIDFILAGIRIDVPDVTSALFAATPKTFRQVEGPEFGQDGLPFRGPAAIVRGQRNKLVGFGEGPAIWSLGRKLTLPAMHFADGVLACDPTLRQFLPGRGGVSLNLAEAKGVFLTQPADGGPTFISTPDETPETVKFPAEGIDFPQPYAVPIGDLRIDASTFRGEPVKDYTGQTSEIIEAALAKNETVYLGPGTYRFKATVQSGLIHGAGIDRTTLIWPTTADALRRGMRGVINATVQGGRFGFNAQAGGKSDPETLFLRTRFRGATSGAMTVHTFRNRTLQECEFLDSPAGFGWNLDDTPGVYRGSDGAIGGKRVERARIIRCVFRSIKNNALDLQPNANEGMISVFSSVFENVGKAGVAIEGGWSPHVYGCRFERCGYGSYAPSIKFATLGTGIVAHVEIDARTLKGNPTAIDVRGQAAVSHIKAMGLAGAVKSGGKSVFDAIESDGTVIAATDSLATRCRVKGLKEGTYLFGEKDWRDVSPQATESLPDRTPPSAVEGLRIRTVNKRNRLDWNPANDPESGIIGYVIYVEDREIARTPFRYEPPADAHGPLLGIAPLTTFEDADVNNRGYRVVAVNGAGLTSDGTRIPLYSIGPAHGRYRTKDGPIEIRSFDGKGLPTGIVDAEGRRTPLAQVGVNGLPSEIFWEKGLKVGE